MIASIYNELLTYEETAGDMVSRVRQLHVYNIFEPLHLLYGEDYEMFNKALFFILHGYSITSKFHVLGQDWEDIKLRIAEHLKIDRESPAVSRNVGEEKGKPVIEQVLLYDDLILLNNPAVIQTISNYLDYQQNRNFKHLCMLKDQYEQFVQGSVDNIRKKSGDGIDFEQKNKNRAYAAQVLEEIAEWEQKVADQVSHLKGAISEFQRKKEDTTTSLRMEDNLQ